MSALIALSFACSAGETERESARGERRTNRREKRKKKNKKKCPAYVEFVDEGLLLLLELSLHLLYSGVPHDLPYLFVVCDEGQEGGLDCARGSGASIAGGGGELDGRRTVDVGWVVVLRDSSQGR
jgi:hypothetical protein